MYTLIKILAITFRFPPVSNIFHSFSFTSEIDEINNSSPSTITNVTERLISVFLFSHCSSINCYANQTCEK